MEEQTREALTNRASWLKGAVLLLFYVLLVVATPILIVISLFGWIGLLFKGQIPSRVQDFGQDMACWYDQTARYLTGNASRRPFPFEDLDCPRDEPSHVPEPSAGSMAQGRDRASMASASESPQAAGGRTDSEIRADAKNADGKAAAAGKKSGKKAGRKKAGKKKAGKKKTAKNQPAGKKTGAAKSAKKKSASGGKKGVNPAGKTASQGESSPSSQTRDEGGHDEQDL